MTPSPTTPCKFSKNGSILGKQDSPSYQNLISWWLPKVAQQNLDYCSGGGNGYLGALHAASALVQSILPTLATRRWLRTL